MIALTSHLSLVAPEALPKPTLKSQRLNEKSATKKVLAVFVGTPVCVLNGPRNA